MSIRRNRTVRLLRSESFVDSLIHRCTEQTSMASRGGIACKRNPKATYLDASTHEGGQTGNEPITRLRQRDDAGAVADVLALATMQATLPCSRSGASSSGEQEAVPPRKHSRGEWDFHRFASR